MLMVRNWDRWQSYRKDRGQPPWIKIHRCVMRNPEWVSLTDAERGQLVAIWLLAADHDGAIPASPEVVAKLCFMDSVPNLNKFIELEFLCHDGVNLASTWRQCDLPETETETEKEKETNPPDGGSCSRHYASVIPEAIIDALEDTAKRVSVLHISRSTKFNVYQWIQKQANDKRHPQAIVDVLGSFCVHASGIKTNPWQYMQKMIVSRSQNYNEADHVQEAENFRCQMMAAGGNIAKLRELAKSIGR